MEIKAPFSPDHDRARLTRLQGSAHRPRPKPLRLTEREGSFGFSSWLGMSDLISGSKFGSSMLTSTWLERDEVVDELVILEALVLGDVDVCTLG